ncbi:TonB-dependent receptor [Gaoshiqia sediminis]|uniref:TonB-dependent receptor n=1 Tax=Gaoshiqia sediminis TaxID=2986998 RepID=A0AA42C5T1_9BACT|nr:TonB-dependent receptor [Gaoshiqia sediminis]MCW0481864.1 TonB-dependent receptor [Gaoshiqia sediminis]
MKLLMILVFSGLMTFASQSYSQMTKVSVDLKQATIMDVFSAIEDQTDYQIAYNSNILDVSKKIDLRVENKSISEVLDLVLKNSAAQYEFVGRYVVISDSKGSDFDARTSQQTRTITGRVTNNEGMPIPGATIVVKGTTMGTITDVNGNFEINDVRAGAVLLVSFVGMKTQEIPTDGQNVVNVSLLEETIGLDEVVAIGYGTVRKSDLTGSVVSVGADKLKDRPYTNAMQTLAGQVSGVQITQTQGAPGLAPTVKVRGASSINAGTTPLYVIDGIPLEDNTTNSTSTGISSGSNMDFNRNPLNFINPNDIESIEILKDASSAAIYGSRGANGVVIITTKQGKAGKTKIEANYEFGLSKVLRETEMMNAQEWMEFQTAARNNSWATIVAANPSATRGLNVTVPVEFSDPAWIARIGNGTDWQDVLLRTALSHNVQVSASGGNEKTQFMVSAGYLDSEGVVDQNTYDRINLRSNIRHKFSDRFRLGLNMGFSRAQEAPHGTSGKSDVVSLALQSDPIFPLYVETGSLGFKDPTSIWNTFVKYGLQLWHPYSLTREAEKKKVMNVMTANSYLEWDVLKDLTFKTALNSNIENTFYNFYWNEGQNWGYSGWVPATADFITLQSYNWVWENTLNYNKTFNDIHDLSVLAGYTVQEQRTDYSNMRSGSFPNDLVHTLNAGKVSSGSTSAQDWSLISYLARANYSLKNKYLVTAAIRADGSSRFGANNRWGYFPSGSVAWRMSEEAFLQDVDWLDNLKVRLSYGETGNNQIPNYGAIGILGYTPYVNGGTVEQGIYTNTFADKNLKWEKTGQTNFGVDFSILDQRVNFSGDIYYSKTKDLLLNVPIPIITGFGSTLTNIGELQNKGFEINVSTRNIDRKLKWVTDLNIFANRNKVLKLGENDAPIDINESSMTSRTAVGKPIGMYYGYVIDGVIMSQAELDNNAYPVWAGSEPGDPRVRDVNKDGKINSDDRTYIGNYQPDFQWGMTNTLSYAGIELSVMLRGSHGAEILNHNARFLKSGVGGGNRNMYSEVSNFWRSEANPGNGMIPKPRMLPTTVRDFGSTYWVEDGSFVRIQNIRIGYNLPQNLVNKMNVAGVKLYLNMENVYVFSDYLGYDPEGSTYQTGVLVGFDYGAYPNPFTATAGVNITF